MRATIEALSAAATPREYRRRFYRNNPIPGAIWQRMPNEPILVNADEIMPANYDIDNLTDDIERVRLKLSFLNRKAPKYFSAPVSFDSGGTKSMLVCNELETLRIRDRLAGEELPVYYARMGFEGNVENFYNLEKLTTKETVDGVLSLLGEVPASANLRYPIYVPRDQRVCTEFSNLKYRSTLNMKYT